MSTPRHGWISRSALLAVLLPASLVASQNARREVPASQEVLLKAEKALDAKDYATAQALLKELTAQQPQNYRAWFDLAYAHTMLGQRTEAIAAYRQTLALQPKLPQASLNLGILLLEEKQAAEAIPHLEAVVAARPADVRAHLVLGDAVAASGEAQRALQLYRKALALSPDSYEAHCALGRLLVEQKEYAEAERTLAQAIQLQPTETAARLEMARLWELTGRDEEARQYYAELAGREPANAEVRRRLGALLLAKKQYAAAAAEFEAAAQTAPSPEDDWHLARAYAGAKKPGQAIPLLQKLAAKDPRDYQVRLLLGSMFGHQGNLAAAQKELEAVVTLHPDAPDAYVELANVLYLQQNFPATLAVLDRVERLAPATLWLHFLRAISLDKLDLVEPALTSYGRFLASSLGQYPDQEFQARQRVKVLKRRLQRGDRGRRR